MKFFIGVTGLIIAGFVIQSYIEWWSIAIIALILGAWLNISSLKSFLFGFLGVFLLWGGYAALINAGNAGILATKIGAIFGGLSPTALILVTGVLGGIVGGFSALTGKLGRALIR